MPDDYTKEWILFELRESLRALAAPGQVALSTVPDDTVRPDELALDYDNWLHSSLGMHQGKFTEEQVAALEAIDSELDKMSGEKNSRLWSEEAVVSGSEWHRVRGLASQALRLLGWEGEPLSWRDYRRYRDEHHRPERL